MGIGRVLLSRAAGPMLHQQDTPLMLAMEHTLQESGAVRMLTATLGRLLPKMELATALRLGRRSTAVRSCRRRRAHRARSLRTRSATHWRERPVELGLAPWGV